jgi:hypothetical protein
MKYLYIFFFISLHVSSQENKIDSLDNKLQYAKLPEDKVNILNDYSNYLVGSVSPDIALPYFQQLATLAESQYDSKKERKKGL